MRRNRRQADENTQTDFSSSSSSSEEDVVWRNPHRHHPEQVVEDLMTDPQQPHHRILQAQLAHPVMNNDQQIAALQDTVQQLQQQLRQQQRSLQLL